MSNQENTVMTVYRLIGGRRIPYHFELSPDMTVVVDKPDYDAIRAETRAQAEQAVHVSPVQAVVKPTQPVTGIVSEEQLPGGGKKIVYRPTQTDIKVGEWVTPSILENPIEGTDELRAQFFAEEEAIKDKHAKDGTVCKPCELGALIRKYRAKLEKLGHLK